MKKRLNGRKKEITRICIAIFFSLFLIANLTIPVKADGEEDTLVLESENADSLEMLFPTDNYAGFLPDDMPEAPIPESNRNSENNDGEKEEVLLGNSSIPSSYDSRTYGRVTSVKNQGPYATCWSFASMAALESSLISRSGFSNPDLSELHYIRYAYFNMPDPLGGITNDVISFNDGDYMLQGGNVTVYYHELANWKGTVTEEMTPYTEQNIKADFTPTTEDAFFNDVIHLQQCYKISKKDTEGIKRAVMDYGAVTSAFYYNAANINASTGAYYTGKGFDETPNHAVAIVGWDDDYSKSNFDKVPENDGAWLLKNSWGTSFGRDGYLWISYDELTLADNSCVLIGENADNFDHNYQYDGSYLDTSIRIGSNSKIANIFTVKGANAQDLKAVSFDLYSADVEYTIQIYKNLQDAGNPMSGTAMLESPLSGKTKYAGFYTVTLPETVRLEPDDTFAVVITLIKSGGVAVITEREAKWGGTYFYTSANAGESMICHPGNINWVDFGANENANIRIKAFTDDAELEVNPFTDVKTGSWQYNPAKYVYDHGYMNGKGVNDGKVVFAPNQNITREEFVRVLYNAEGCPVVTISNPYPDVKEDTWYTAAVLWARENGIANGRADGKFGIGNNITRQDMAVMLYKYALYKGYDTTRDDSKISEFADAAQVSNYAINAMNWAVTQDIISGKGESEAEKSEMRLDPKGQTTRAECASMIKKLMEKNQ